MSDIRNDDPIRELDDDLDPEPGINTSNDVSQPGIVAGVGSSGLGSADLEPEEDEPETRRHPDNDGETIEG
jgi:hypothetical protein